MKQKKKKKKKKKGIKDENSIKSFNIKTRKDTSSQHLSFLFFFSTASATHV